MINNLDNPTYYLDNFEFVLTWVRSRYEDLLVQSEIAFIERFATLPLASRALLVRMVMRKGNLFRESKLNYAEIGDTKVAASCLIEHGWIEEDPGTSVEQLAALLTKCEFAQALGLSHMKAARKSELLEAALQSGSDRHRFSQWMGASGGSGESAYEVRVAELCDRFKLMFFGNPYQDWSEFVLADLGIFAYEKVDFSPASRAFQSRDDVDLSLRLHTCRERLNDEQPLEEIETELCAMESGNAWLLRKRDKYLFRIAQRYEQRDDRADALRVYQQSGFPGARERRIRVLEKDGRHAEAYELAALAATSPESDSEAQHLLRVLPRLRRKLALPRQPEPPKQLPPRMELRLARPADVFHVEEVVRTHLQQTEIDQAGHSVHYVENTLINSLFGLLCWDAIFRPVPGAFFHPFQIGPADLHGADFYRHRRQEFESCLSQLRSGQYRETIRSTFARKIGIQSPFVFWGAFDETLMEHALACFPAHHLEKWFMRMLADLQRNCTGFPDLIQLWPQQRRYRMIEVKGPGDRLQDNQIRLLDFCMGNGMPVAVCHVAWEEQAA